MRSKNMTGVAAAGLMALVLTGCGGGGEEPAAQEPSTPQPSQSAEGTSSPSQEEPKVLPGATSGGEDAPAEESPEASASAGDPNGSPAPGPDDVAGNGVVVPSPSAAAEGDGREFPGFPDQSTVDRSAAEEVAIEAMRGLSVWDTTVDTKPGDAGARVESLVSEEALERGVGGPGRWTPMWWRQATAAGAWSSADTELATGTTHVEVPEGVEMLTVEVSWDWHATTDEVVPEGDSHSCTVAVEEVGGQQTVTAFDCQDSIAEPEDMSS